MKEIDMNPTTATKRADEMTLTESIIALLRYYLGGRKGLILLTVAAMGTGMLLNWGWLVAAGIAPILLTVAPCAVMCALGLCMNRVCNKSGTVQSQSDNLGSSGTSTSAKPDGKTRDEM